MLAAARDDVSDRISFEFMGEDEGLAMIAFHAYGQISSARINRLGGLTGSFEFNPVSYGEYIHIFKVRAGDYRMGQGSPEVV